jgi:hypothetical protein
MLKEENMETITIIRRIKVKAIVTERLKQELVQQIQEGIKKMEMELSFLEQRNKKALTELTLKASPQVQAVREQFEWEKKKREEGKAALLEQLKKINVLEEGQEVLQGEVEGPVEIKLGDSWDGVLDKEIVIKDGVVVNIR